MVAVDQAAGARTAPSACSPSATPGYDAGQVNTGTPAAGRIVMQPHLLIRGSTALASVDDSGSRRVGVKGTAGE
jgi:hypothetical protein